MDTGSARDAIAVAAAKDGTLFTVEYRNDGIQRRRPAGRVGR